MKRMKTLSLLLSLVMILGIFAGCKENASKTTKVDLNNITLSDQQITDVSKKTNKLLKTEKFSGTVCVNLNGKTIFKDSYGYADANKETPIIDGTRYQIGSLTKAFTGIATLQLVANNKLNLNDTIDKFFEGEKYLSDITVRDLLEMRSGLVSYTIGIESSAKKYAFIKDYIAQDYNNAGIKNYISSYILKTGTDDITGEYSHSHSDYYLLGLIIEQASGQSYEYYIQKNIIEPLKLTNTGFIHNDVTFSGYYETGEYRTNLDNPYLNNKYVMFSSLGLYSNVKDMNTLYKAILTNRVMGKNKDKISVIDTITKSSSGYSCGFYIENDCIYAEGNTTIHSAFSYINPQRDEIIILLSNRDVVEKVGEITKSVYNITNAKINGILINSMK